MSRSAVLPWLLLAIWTAWIAAAQGLLLSVAPLSPWVPDVVLVLLLALASRLETHELPRLAVIVALGRLAVSIEPAPAALAGTLGVVLVVRGLRSIVELGDALTRCALALTCALALARWHAFVLESRALAGARLYAPQLHGTWDDALGALGPHALSRAASTALFALAFGPALVHLPGLTPLRKRRTWHRVASARSW